MMRGADHWAVAVRKPAGDIYVESHDIDSVAKRHPFFAKPFLRGADLEAREDEWVGSRPCTTDGLPLIGVTRSPRVYAAGGHGMWGITLGPATGRLLADQIVNGRVPAELEPFSPTR